MCRPSRSSARPPDGRQSAPDPAAAFDPLRPTLARIAYRMLGSVADAEDVVQDAFLRWMATDRAAVRQPESFLRRTVTRLCLDQLKSARRRREVYPGEWLPEPVIDTRTTARRRDAAADDGAGAPVATGARRLHPARRVRRRASMRSPRRSAAIRRPPASLQPGRAAMCARTDPASTCRKRKAWKSPRHSSMRHAAAT